MATIRNPVLVSRHCFVTGNWFMVQSRHDVFNRFWNGRKAAARPELPSDQPQPFATKRISGGRTNVATPPVLVRRSLPRHSGRAFFRPPAPQEERSGEIKAHERRPCESRVRTMSNMAKFIDPNQTTAFVRRNLTRDSCSNSKQSEWV
jgi:hypothetical protein